MRRIMVIGPRRPPSSSLRASSQRQHGAERIREPMRIHVVEHASTDTAVDTDGDGADPTGDLLTPT